MTGNLHFGQYCDLHDIVSFDLPAIESGIRQKVEEVGKGMTVPVALGFEDLLDPDVAQATMPLYRLEDYRSAVIKGCEILVALIRKRTGLKLDGVALVTLVHKSGWPGLGSAVAGSIGRRPRSLDAWCPARLMSHVATGSRGRATRSATGRPTTGRCSSAAASRSGSHPRHSWRDIWPFASVDIDAAFARGVLVMPKARPSYSPERHDS